MKESGERVYDVDFTRGSGHAKNTLAQELDQDVTITYFTQRESVLIVPGQGCSYSRETLEILEKVVDLTDKLHLTAKDFVRDGQAAQDLLITRIPAFVLDGQSKGRVRFFGIPAGYEFSTLVEDLIDVSKGQTNLISTEGAIGQKEESEFCLASLFS